MKGAQKGSSATFLAVHGWVDRTASDFLLPIMSSSNSHAPIRIALLGAGTFASSAHHEVLSALITAQRVEIILVWSRTSSSAEKLAASYPTPIPFYHQLVSHSTPLESAAAALQHHNASLDAAVIALPPGPQQLFAALALNLGLHVMLEKPLALDLPGARRLLSVAAASPDKALALAENFRFEPALHRASELVKETSGGVVAARLTVKSPMKEGSRYGRGWRLQMDGPGILLDGCVHHVAGLRVVFGCDVDRVSAHCSRKAGWFKGNDTVIADLTMANGVHVSAFVTYAASTFIWELEVVGKACDVVVQRLPGKPGYRVSTVQSGKSGNEVNATEVPFSGIDREFEAFVETCITGDLNPKLDAKKGFNDMAAVFAMLESSETRKEVTVATVDDSCKDLSSR